MEYRYDFLFRPVCIVSIFDNTYLFLEALYIRKAKNVMNRDLGMDINPIMASFMLKVIEDP